MRSFARYALPFLIVLSPLVLASDFDTAQAALAETEADLHSLEPLAWLPVPFNDSEAQAWVRHAVDTKQAAQTATAPLDSISTTVDLPPTRGTNHNEHANSGA